MVARYRLLGEDVSASPSPAMMNAAFGTLEIDAVYEAVSVCRGEFRSRFLALREETDGFNLTIPFKSEVIPFLDELDDVSQRIGAANVVKRSGGRYVGLNSDVNGITESLREHHVGRVARALVIGAGGAARAFCEAMSQVGCGEVTVAARTRQKGEAFASEMSKTFPKIGFEVDTIDGLGQIEPDLVFNATPIGSGGLPLPEPLVRVIYGHATVFDAVYRPMKTELLRAAERKGARTIYGYEMLLNQGTLAFEMWTGRRAPKHAMGEALRQALGAGD